MPDSHFTNLYDADLYVWLNFAVIGLVVAGGGVAIVNGFFQRWLSKRRVKKLQCKRDELVNQLLNEPSGHPTLHAEEQ